MHQYSTNLLNIPITLITHAQALDTVEDYMQTRDTKVVVTPYASFWYWANKDSSFRHALQQADLSLPDGIGIIAAIKFLRKKVTPLPILKELQLVWHGMVIGIQILTGKIMRFGEMETVRGVDLVSDLLTRANDKGYKIFFLGGWETTQKALEAKLRNDYPDLTFAMSIGAEDVRAAGSGQQLQQAIDQINSFDPNLVLVAFGPPFQEKWAIQHRSHIKTGAIMCVGATFDLLSGQLTRAPLAMRRMGLEWAWRFVTQPHRIKRILSAFPYFPLYVACKKWQQPDMVV